MAWPPTSSGTTGIAYPAARSRRTTSWVATAIATATTPIHTYGTNTRMAMTPKPKKAPTAIAAGRFRPAREPFLGGSAEAPAPSVEAVSVSATGMVTKGAAAIDGSSRMRSSHLQQLAFFVFDQIVDLGGVGRRGLVQFLLGPAHLVLACLAVLLDAAQFFHGLASDVAHRHLGVLTLRLGLLDEFAPAFLGQLGYRDANDVAVVARVEAEVGVPDGVLDVAQLTGLVRLDDDQTGLGDVDAGQLRNGRGRPVVVDGEAGEHAGVGSTGPDGRQVVTRHRDGLLHLLLGFEEGFVDHSLFSRRCRSPTAVSPVAIARPGPFLRSISLAQGTFFPTPALARCNSPVAALARKVFPVRW